MDPVVYAKEQLALGIIFTLPGAPVVYYGDEVALAGRADPDSRRVMPSDADLSSLQKQTRAWVQALGAVRACAASLRRGTYRTLYADAETLVYTREAADSDAAVVVAARQPTSAFTQPLAGIAAGNYVDLLSGRMTPLSPESTSLALAPLSLAVYLPATSPCVGIATAQSP